MRQRGKCSNLCLPYQNASEHSVIALGLCMPDPGLRVPL